MSEIAALRQMVEELAARVAAVEDGFAVDHLAARRLGLSPSEAIILSLLLKRQAASKASLMTVLYGAAPDDPPGDKIIDCWICRIRRQLADVGFENTIGNIRGVGYFIAPTMKAAIALWLAEGEA